MSNNQQNETWYILYIEDDEDDFYLAREMLTQSRGRKVELVWASTFEDGSQKLLNDHFDAVLVDFDLGTHNGIELIQKFKDVSSPLILYTGHGSHDVDIEAMLAGATLYLTKNEVTPLLFERSIRYAIELKQKENELRLTSERLEAVLQALPVGVWITDQKGQIIEINKQADQIWAGDAPLSESFDQYPEYLSWDDKSGKKLDGDDYTLARTARTGEAVPPTELRIRRFDGSEGIVLVSTEPIKDSEGRFSGAVGISVDITERKRVEQNLLLNEERFQRAVQMANILVWNWDLSTNIVHSDGKIEEIAGLSTNVPALEAFQYVHPEDREAFIKVLQNVSMNGGNDQTELRIVHPGKNEPVWLEAHVSAILNEQGQVSRLIGVSVEITDRKRRELNAAFLDGISEVLAHISSPDDLMQAIGKMTKDYFRVSRVTFAEVDEAANTTTAIYSYHDQGLPTTSDTQRLSDFSNDEWLKEQRAGKVIAVDDIETDPRITNCVEAYRRWHIRSQIIAPYSKDGHLHFVIAVLHSEPRHWQPDEIKLVHELSERIYPSLERARIEKALKKSEEMFSIAFRSSPIAMAILRLADEKYLDVNYSHSKVSGYSREEVIGKTPLELGFFYRSGDREKILKQLLENGAVHNYETLIRRKYGVIREHQFSIQPIELNGERCVLVTVIDITEHKRAERALMESEERFRTMADGTPVIIWVTNTAGEDIFVNHAYREFFGISIEQIRAKGWQPLVHPEDIAQYVDNFIECVREQRSFRGQGRVRRFDGEWRWIDSFAQPRFSETGEFLGMAGSSLDITDRKNTEEALQHYTEELERLNQALRDFTSIASHDLQEPLRKIHAFGRLLDSHFRDELGEKGQDYIDRITSAADRMNIMLLGLLNYSRVTSHGEQFTRVDLNKVVSEVLSDLDGRILETGGKVEIEELPIIHADPLQIQQLFQNLIGNALKYHRPNVPPIVNITCSVSKEKVAEIRIQDNGVGFDIKNGNRLFEPFTRLHGRSEFEGAGMGLAICKKIVERHNGTITASSTPGEGAIFTITLPVGE